MSKGEEEAEIEIGETHIVVKHKNSSTRHPVEILYKSLAKSGDLSILIILKSKAHNDKETHFGRYAVSGAYATEMLLEPYKSFVMTYQEVDGQMVPLPIFTMK